LRQAKEHYTISGIGCHTNRSLRYGFASWREGAGR
jgi:hypothetical protein